MIRHIFVSILIAMVATIAAPSAARNLITGGLTDNELMLLPEYCRVRVKHGTQRQHPEVKKWMAILGDEYLDIHHMCFGLNYLRYRSAMDFSNRDFYYGRAIGNFEYVIKAADPDFVLLPEVYYHLGRAKERKKDFRGAMKAYRNAIAHNAEYIPPYAAIYDMLVMRDKLAEAQAALEKGLEQDPDSKLLLRRKQELAERRAADSGDAGNPGEN